MSDAGAIATPHYLATASGQKVLEAGGSAVDATIAAAAVLAVVYPHMTGLGGDSWSILKTTSGDTVAINGTGTHPRGVDVERMQSEHGGVMPLFGAASSPVPGAVKAWSTMHEVAGKLEWAFLLEDAISFARDGVPVAPALGRELKQLWPEISNDPAINAIFSSEHSGPKRVGETLVQPALEGSLRAIAAGGPDAFYAGALASALAQGMKSLGSVVEEEDFALQRSDRAPAISADFQGYRVSTAPPNSQGFTLLQILKVLERGGLKLGDPGSFGEVASLFACANTERETHLADPEFGHVDVNRLLSNDHVGELLRQSVHGSIEGSQPLPRASGDTVGIASIDSTGLAVSSLHSIFYAFGARVMDPGTGIILQNRSASFSLDPEHPAFLRPGSRPPSTLMPVLVDHPDGRLSAVATMGGRSQAQIQAQLIEHITQDCSPQEIVAKERFVVGAFGPSLENAVLTEKSLPAQAQSEAKRRGLMVVSTEGYDDRCGHSQIVQSGPKDFAVGSDPRSDGLAPPS